MKFRKIKRPPKPRDAKPSVAQRLPPEGAHFCDGCKALVVFKVRRTRTCASWPGKRIAYLYCPRCGHRAIQIRFSRKLQTGGNPPEK